MPKSMGCLFWQYNDCWPVVSWSSVDYYGRWKALHYFARRFYSPLLISGLEDSAQGTVEIHGVSDCAEERRGTLDWQITDMAGVTLAGSGGSTIILPPRAARKIQTLQLQEQIRTQGPGNILVWLKLLVDRQVMSESLVTFVPPKDLKLVDPTLATKVVPDSDGFRVTISAAHPALWCWLSLADADAVYSDNFLHVTVGHPAQIHIRPARPMSTAEFTTALRVRSLFDTFSPPAT